MKNKNNEPKSNKLKTNQPNQINQFNQSNQINSTTTKTRLQRLTELDTAQNINYNTISESKYTSSDYIQHFFCAYRLGLSKKCLLATGTCSQCWNTEWEGEKLKEE